MKKIYLIRHSAPFIEFTNYEDCQIIDIKCIKKID